jgi:hypothetical protein
VLQVGPEHIVGVWSKNPGGGGLHGVDFFVAGIHHDARSRGKSPWVGDEPGPLAARDRKLPMIHAQWAILGLALVAFGLVLGALLSLWY